MEPTVKERLKAKRSKVRVALTKKVATKYAPEMKVPEDELRAIGAMIVKMGMSDKPLDFSILKALLLKLRVTIKNNKLSSRIDEREFEAAVEGAMWLQGMSVELQKTYEAMGYQKEVSPHGYTFRKIV